MAKQSTKISDLIADDKNFNKGSEFGNSLIEKSFRKFGAGRSILIDKNNRIIAGNKSVENAMAIGMEDVQIVESDGTKIIAVKRTDIDLDSEQGREMALADNASAKANIVFDAEVIEAELGEAVCVEWGIDKRKDIITNDDKEIQAVQKLSDRYLIPPFSVLNTREGLWQERKKLWKSLIKDFGESRKETLGSGGITIDENSSSWMHNPKLGNGVSLLDPVLSEIVNLWFGLQNSKTFDCFAGDSVFGYVSSYMGNSFTGIELRQEQTNLNNERIKGFNSKYICDDGRNILNHIEENSQDLLFSCPPYFDLEVYSDMSNDASNQQNYEDFLKIIDTAFTNAIKCLKENRFAVITVGDIRDKKGNYYRFPDHIKDIFNRNNLTLQNELILIEPIAFGAMRAEGNMKFRKITKCHQNVLVFFKGNPKEIKNIYPKIEIKEDESTDV
jgi:DNA modification methylase